jgi:hypothetical protein
MILALAAAGRNTKSAVEQNKHKSAGSGRGHFIESKSYILDGINRVHRMETTRKSGPDGFVFSSRGNDGENQENRNEESPGGRQIQGKDD